MKSKRILTIFVILIIQTQFLISQNSGENFFGGIKTVVIDAGHGGKDVGCLGSVGKEKDVALSISLKLGSYLEQNFPHLKVVFTRKTDVFIELFERAKIANRNKADLFICIHANAGGSAAFGTETYVMGNAKSETNLKAAQRENASILLEENYETKYDNFDPNSAESYIALTLMQSAFQEQSIEFADKVQRQFRERVGRKDRGVKQAPFLVLHQTTMPSVLIETGFLTNASEEKFLTSDVGQDYLASAIYRAFKEYNADIEQRAKILYESEVKAQTRNSEREVSKKDDQKKAQITTVSNDDVTFMVQLATSSKLLETKPENFKRLEGVSYYEAGGLYRYTYGAESSWENASTLQKEVVEKGYHDAFIIAFHKGKRISVNNALELLK
jgi:N-acetylmuramoyl-L-alanine amidase